MLPRVVLLALVIAVLVPSVVVAAPVCPLNASPWRGRSPRAGGNCADYSFVQRGDGYVYNGADEQYCTCDAGFRCAGPECACHFDDDSVLTLTSANRTRSQCIQMPGILHFRVSIPASNAAVARLHWSSYSAFSLFDAGHDEAWTAPASVERKILLPSALSWGKYVTNMTDCASGSNYCLLRAYCPIGTSIVSGGCYCSSLTASLTGSYPYALSDNWTCYSSDPQRGSYYMRAYAICA